MENLNSDEKGPVLPLFFEETFYDETGEEIVNIWTKKDFLGKGGYSKVYRLEQNEHIYAGKIITKKNLDSDRKRELLRNEICIHRKIDSASIVKFYRYFESQDYYILLLESCRSVSLADVLKSRKRLTEPEVRYYTKGIGQALIYLRKCLIVHNDIKPGNIFLAQDMSSKLGDFGLATQLTFEDEYLSVACGTPNYLAPEVLICRGNPSRGYSFPCDVWSFGVTLYTLLFGKAPFERSNTKKTYKRISKCDFTFPEYIKTSDSTIDLINKLLILEPEDRLKAENILQDAFYSGLTPKSLPETALFMEPKSLKY